MIALLSPGRQVVVEVEFGLLSFRVQLLGTGFLLIPPSRKTGTAIAAVLASPMPAGLCAPTPAAYAALASPLSPEYVDEPPEPPAGCVLTKVGRRLSVGERMEDPAVQGSTFGGNGRSYEIAPE
ncbi:hypothetical protein KC333_g74 [Hortaea werneckii]|nr:hypothetical protein KC333_g74 [Hortaea werneckii]